jgi:prepilin-type N-terminal cleavage/methylation domain-containing protein
MVAMRKQDDAGFTLTELMVVVVILSLLAAVSTPLFRRDNNARKGRGWANIVAQGLQRARFQAMGDRTNIHVLLYRDHFETFREDPPDPPGQPNTTFVLLSSTPGPEVNDDRTVAIWDARTDNTPPTAQNNNFTVSPSPPVTAGPRPNEIVFLPIGSTLNNANWRIYIRNELLPGGHPDASFVINVRGLTGFVSANDKVVLP